jgi:hypothetical protein
MFDTAGTVFVVLVELMILLLPVIRSFSPILLLMLFLAEFILKSLDFNLNLDVFGLPDASLLFPFLLLFLRVLKTLYDEYILFM